MFVGAGLVLSGCGDDDTATTPAPAPPPPPPAPEPEPEPPAPEAPATPTGLMVSATTETSITWTWDAVEGAIGYAVQVSADEMFDATDTIHPSAEATFTASPLPPETSVFVRVAAAGGTLEAPLLSAWTTHVTGMSAMPPPPPPAPMAPATPTGLMAESGEGSISWSWEAVEGADGYAVQVSMDEMFDDADETTYTTETTHGVADLGYGETRFARVASTSGTGDDMLTSMWTTHTTGMSAAAPPPPPAPEAPAAPTGLTAESGEGSITWSWDAVEGADGYAVQVSMDEMFDDADATTQTTETTHSVADLGYAATRFARVASTSGTGDDMLMSAWTTHLTGISAMAPPPVPDPVEVTFSLSEDADSPAFMVADADDDEATAKASVNTEIVVTSNTSAVITPMFVDGANGVSVNEGDNMPFGRVSWSLLQSAVLGDGATFMVQRATIGANQEMEPSGDVAYLTCGPFTCQDGTDPPEISIANSSVCNAWDPTVEIQVGKIDNDVIFEDGETDDTGNDGVDVGIVTSSTTAMKVKHVFSGVANGKNTSVTTDAAKGSDKTLAMKAVDGVIVVDDADNNVVACDNTYQEGRDALFEPEGCFRLIGPGPGDNAPDYLAGYSLELSPQGAGVTWGRVDWDDDPFEDLTCDSMTMMVADHVDICTMFDAEVDYAIGDGWSPEVVFNDDDQIVMWRAPAENSGTNAATTTGKFFKTLWFDDNLNGKIKNDGGADRAGTVGQGDTANAMHDLYNQNVDDGNIEMIWEFLTDEDGDPNAGDLGKVDMVSPDDDETAVDESAADDNAVHPDGNADNYTGAAFADIRKCSEADGGDDDDGSICDAVWTRDAEVLFADGTFGCTTTRTVSITCTWDADGGMADGRNALPQAFDPDTNLGNFLNCEAE